MTTAPEVQELNIVAHVKVRLNELSKDEVREILGSAFRRELELANKSHDEFLMDCQVFETKYNLSSDDFLERFESGELGDDADFFHWYAVKHSFDTWARRREILLGVSLPE